MKSLTRHMMLAILLLFSTIVWAQQTSFTPTDNGKALVNPGMGWQLYFYSNVLDHYGSKLDPEDTVDEFPGVGVVFMRIPWSFLEPEKDKFNWEILDTPAQRWIDKGKRIAICISATENWTRQGTPQWVFDEGAKYYDVLGFLEADYADATYLAAVDHCVQRLAEHYDENPNVDYVAIGHFGMWGEGHTEITTPEHGKTWGYSTQKKYIDIYTNHFKHTQVCMNDDFAGPYTRVATSAITVYAHSKGVTFWDSSILVQPQPNHWYHAEMAQRFWPTMPVILEHEHYQNSVKAGAWDKELLLKSIEDYHASYMSIHTWPRLELEENRDIIDRINLRMGYRIQLMSASWPKVIHQDERFSITSTWRNDGVAPCYSGGYPCYTVKNKKGGIVAVLVDTCLNVRDLKTGAQGEAPTQTTTMEFNVAQIFRNSMGIFSRTIQMGDFEIYFSIGQLDGTPTLALPYDNCDGHKRYLMGQISLEDAKAQVEALRQKANEARALLDSTRSAGRETLIKRTSQISSNCEWTAAGTTVHTLLDGNTSTYFHSNPSQSLASGALYLQVALQKPVDSIYLEMTGRGDGAGTGNQWHDTPNKIRIEASNSPDTGWKNIATQDYSIENVDNAHFMTPEPISLGASYAYLRFYMLHVTSNLDYFNISEFQLYNGKSDQPSLYVQLETQAKALEACRIAAIEKANTSKVTQEDVEELQAAIDAFRKAIHDLETSVQAIKQAPSTSDVIYDLGGRQLTQAPHDVYIHNGQKRFQP